MVDLLLQLRTDYRKNKIVLGDIPMNLKRTEKSMKMLSLSSVGYQYVSTSFAVNMIDAFRNSGTGRLAMLFVGR